MEKSPQLKAKVSIRVTLFIEGSALPDTVQITSITITRAINRVPTARLVIAAGDMLDKDFAVCDSHDFKLGATVKINAGYGTDEETIFEGVVTRQALQISGQNVACLVVECSDRDLKLARTGANGLLVIATDASVTEKLLSTLSTPTLKVTYGKNLLTFHAELDTGLGLAGNHIETAELPTHDALTPANKRQQLDPGLARIGGRMSFQGSAKAVVGGVIEIAGVGKRFSGKVFTTGVTHVINDGQWRTEAQFGLPAQWFSDPADSAGLLPADARAAENNFKASAAYGESNIEFNEKQAVITITTPGGNKIVLSDIGNAILLQDQNANKVELNSAGITLTSLNDITLSAKGQITLDAVGAISINSKADVKTAGLNISNQAQMGFTAKATASAELSASGQTVVKGAMVMIN